MSLGAMRGVRISYRWWILIGIWSLYPREAPLQTSRIRYFIRLKRSDSRTEGIRILKCSPGSPSWPRWPLRTTMASDRRGKKGRHKTTKVIAYLRRVRSRRRKALIITIEINFRGKGKQPMKLRKSRQVITLVAINLVHHFSKYLSRTNRKQMRRIAQLLPSKSKLMPTAAKMKMRKIKIQLITVAQNTLKAFRSLLMRLLGSWKKLFQIILF